MWIVSIGLLLIVAGTGLPLLQIEGDWYKYVYAAGALLLIFGRLMMPGAQPGASLRLRRMMRLETWSGIIFIVASVISFLPPTLVGPRDWIAFTIAGGVLTAYTSIMIPHLKKKEGSK